MDRAINTTTASPDEIVQFFRVLADGTRLVILRLLSLSDLRAGEIRDALQLPANAVSYHLKQLRSLGLLHDRRSSADARDVYYRVDLERLQRLYAKAGDALHPGLVVGDQLAAESAKTAMLPLRVLFLCTHNSARSQLAEAILRQMGGDQVEVYSAGSMPTEVHPDAAAVLRELGLDPAPLYAKPLERFIGERFDYIITVCDRVRDICPAFPGDPNQVHWGIADPAVVEDPARRLETFRQVAYELQTRSRYLLLLPHPATGQRFRVREAQSSGQEGRP
jgi:protein-tyrosine-phosphatase/DNA-binding transcriptional ArsR family regulator